MTTWWCCSYTVLLLLKQVEQTDKWTAHMQSSFIALWCDNEKEEPAYGIIGSFIDIYTRSVALSWSTSGDSERSKCCRVILTIVSLLVTGFLSWRRETLVQMLFLNAISHHQVLFYGPYAVTGYLHCQICMC